jgi:hypothetical protein
MAKKRTYIVDDVRRVLFQLYGPPPGLTSTEKVRYVEEWGLDKMRKTNKRR